LQKNFKTTDYTDEHGYKEVGTGGIRGANGAGQTKNSASKLDRFPLFSANPSLLGSFDSLAPALSPCGLHSCSLPRACPGARLCKSEKSVFSFLQPPHDLLIMKLQDVVCI
jgi:hypothetical protein